MISMKITNPGNPKMLVEYRRHFTVAGTIEHDEEIPSDACFKVEVFNSDGECVRTVSTDRKDNSSLYLEHPMLVSYKEELDPGKEQMKKFGFPELLVKDVDAPLETLKDASFKAFYSDTAFKAIVVTATDVEHGLIFDDGIGYTNADGTPFEVLPKGDYRVNATLSDREGKKLASDEVTIHISQHKDQMLCRFNPWSHKQRMAKWAEENDYAIIIDCLPGYLEPYLWKWFYHMGILPMYRSCDIALFQAPTKIRMFVYLIDPTSTSYETELAYLQTQNAVEDPERLVCYHYDIGEAVVGSGRDYEREAKILEFEKDEFFSVCRVDVVNESAKENVFALDESGVVSSIMDIGDCTVEAGSQVAIMSVVRPFAIDAKYFKLTKDNIYEISNRIETLRFEFDDGEKKTVEERKLMLDRVENGASIGLSIFEAYNIFEVDKSYSGRTVKISITGFDSLGNETKAKGSLTIKVK